MLVSIVPFFFFNFPCSGFPILYIVYEYSFVIWTLSTTCFDCLCFSRYSISSCLLSFFSFSHMIYITCHCLHYSPISSNYYPTTVSEKCVLWLCSLYFLPVILTFQRSTGRVHFCYFFTFRAFSANGHAKERLWRAQRGGMWENEIKKQNMQCKKNVFLWKTIGLVYVYVSRLPIIHTVYTRTRS